MFTCLQIKEADPDDIPYADRVLRCIDDEGRQEEVPVLAVPRSEWMAANVILDHFVAVSIRRSLNYHIFYLYIRN